MPFAAAADPGEAAPPKNAKRRVQKNCRRQKGTLPQPSVSEKCLEHSQLSSLARSPDATSTPGHSLSQLAHLSCYGGVEFPRGR
jgi:hypothetical protein